MISVVGEKFGGRPDGPSGVPDTVLAELRGCGPMQYEVPNVQVPRSDCVERLQQVLQARGAAIKVTGNYRDQTRERIKEFQAARGLPADGALTDATLQALIDLPKDTANWDLRRECVSLSLGHSGAPPSQGRCVTTLHDRLNAQGAKLPGGDRFDETTDKEVRTFQGNAGLPAIGVVGPTTKQALYAAQRGGVDPGAASTCSLQYCAIYISRSSTADLASAFPDSWVARSILASGISIFVCYSVRRAPSVNVTCQTATQLIVEHVASEVTRAAKQHACLAVRVGYPPKELAPGGREWWPLGLSTYSGRNCRD